MDPVRKQRRSGILIMIAVFVVVGAWWLLLMPAFSKYKVHRQEARLKDKLGSISPPTGDKPGEIQITRLPKFDYMSATRLDAAKLDCISGGMYYRNEFTKAGFAYDGEKIDPKQNTKTLSFAGQGYGASVLCGELRGVQSDLHIYFIEIWSVVR